MKKELMRRVAVLAATVVLPLLGPRAGAAERVCEVPLAGLPANQTTVVAPEAEWLPQLADEVTRRLRRMGINIIRTRLDQPYDPIEDLC